MSVYFTTDELIFFNTSCATAQRRARDVLQFAYDFPLHAKSLGKLWSIFALRENPIDQKGNERGTVYKPSSVPKTKRRIRVATRCGKPETSANVDVYCLVSLYTYTGRFE